MAQKLVYESVNSRIIFRDNKELGVHIVKTLNEDFPSPQEVKQFFNEYEILKGKEIDGIRKVFKFDKLHNKHSLYLEFVEGMPLRDFIKPNIPLSKCLKISIETAKVLDKIHANNIIHKDISPGNIIWNDKLEKTNFIDFGISSTFSLKKQDLGNPEKLEGTLAYISPEQTGRMNRIVDYRSDLYSLGIVMYELFTGIPPFVQDDAMGLVHSHLAQKPKPLDAIRPDIPGVLSDIVIKLLEKNAEDRYQSSLGLIYDLESVLTQIEETGKVKSFEICKKDNSGKFKISQKLYGREKELAKLIRAFENVSKGAIELILVAGFSGTGKSSLVHEIHKPITEKRGYFIEGKFDQYQKAIPYSAIIQAFETFISYLLTEKQWKLDYFNERILAAVGSEGKVLIDVLPDLELIIGKQPDVIELGGAENQNRFNYVFRKFVGALSSSQHPLVLFVDDLQWADYSSLDLLYALLLDLDLKYFLGIGAYRDNEVSKSHPLMINLKNLNENGVYVETITIDNLKFDDVNSLISESLDKPKSYTEKLTELIISKTGGNAFFVTQFLDSLYENNLLTYNYAKETWSWDISKIQSQDLPDDVVKLMAGKVSKLSLSAQEILKIASCIGNSFDLETLSLISELDDDHLIKNLNNSLEEGLIIPINHEYHFAHDRIQQAVYGLISEDDKISLHFKIGNILLEKIPEDQKEDKLFDIVNQLNWGINKLETVEEKLRIRKLNIRAAEKAKHSSAFDAALEYVNNGISLLGVNHWENEYEDTIKLYTEAADAAFLTSKIDKMNEAVEQIFANAKSLDDKIKPYEIKINALKAENRLLEALNTGLELLALLGEKFPKNPSMLKVFPDLMKTMLMLRGKSDEDIENLPINTQPYKIAAIRILAFIAPSSYWGNPKIFPFIIFRMVQLSLKYGNTPVSSFGYSTLGVIMVGVLNKIDLGYRYGKLGENILNKFHAKEWLAQVFTPIYALIVIWKDHIKESLKPLQDSYHVGLETGAIEFACVNANIYCIHAYLMGKPLEQIEEETKDYSVNFKRYNQYTNYNYNEVYRQAMHNLMGKTKNPCLLVGGAYDEEKMMKIHQEDNNRTSIFFIYFHKLILHSFFNNYEEAIVNAVAGRKLLDAVLAKLEVAYFHFYEALSYGMLALNSKGKIKLNSQFYKNKRKLRFWAQNAPENFMHKLLIINAIESMIGGKLGQARDQFDASIQLAEQHGFLNEESLANELAGELCIVQKNSRLASFYFKNAYQLYREWGAEGKLNDLQNRYPDYVSTLYSRPNRKSISLGMRQNIGTATSSSSESILDLSSIIKASASITSEIVLEKLLIKLIKILSENIGASVGYLLLESDGELVVKAVSLPSLGEEKILDISLKDSDFLPKNLISYVQRTKEEVVLGNAKLDRKFNHDPYISSNNILSVLVYPVQQKGELRGILYFENNLAVEAFSIERFELLSLLSGQIAVSLENALLYDNLEQKVMERTAELEKEKKKSDALLLNILPEKTAEELKQFGKTKPRKYDMVTVMFTDFKDFTKVSESMEPEEIVNEIDYYFGTFDKIMEKYGIEKIKTIGDAYMCACGLPQTTFNHAEKIADAALDIMKFMRKVKEDRVKSGKSSLALRIGIHSGPVVAGVVGLHKFAYDIWGDTVNTASRMESHSEPWQINVSEVTFQLLKGKFEFVSRGKIEAKNKGKINMYFLNQ